MFLVVLQHQWLRHGDAALARRTRFQPGNPGLQVGQAVNFDTAPPVDAHPAPVGDIGDAVFVAQKFAALELPFQHFEQAPAFVVVALDGRWKFFREIAIEHVRLAHHRPDAGHLEHQPLRDSRLAFFVLGQQLAGFARQVEQDGAAFEYGEVAVGAVHDGGNAAVGIQTHELGLFLVAFAQVDAVDGIRQADFLQEHGYFPAVGRGRGV